jgi:hypothetical protein
MKNLSEFKKVLQSCLTHKLEICSKVTDRNGNVIKEQPFAPVAHIQSNSFALDRGGKLSWLEFRKASQWTFNGATATQNFMDGGKIELTLKTPEFFGL